MTESEYITLAESVKEGIWFRGLVIEMLGHTDPLCVYCDSPSALALSKNPQFHDRSKHIDIRYHYLREKTMNDEIKLEKIASSNNPVDLLTKSLPASRMQYLLNLLKVGVG